MKITGSLFGAFSMELESYSELLAWRVTDTSLVDATRRFQIYVYRFGSEIYHSKEVDWDHNGFNQLIEKVTLRFPEIPRGLSFVVRVTEIVHNRKVRFETPFSSLLHPRVRARPSGNRGKQDVTVKVKLKVTARTAYSLISASMREERRRWRKKTTTFPKTPSPLSVVKQTRASPETVNDTWKNFTWTTINPAGTTTTGSYVKRYREYTSVRTPGFKKKSRYGTLPHNAYHMFQWRKFDGLVARRQRLALPPNGTGNFSNSDTSVEQLGGFTGLGRNHLPDGDNRAIAKLAGKINASDVNIPEDLAQFKQTASLFTNNVSRLRQAIDFLHGGFLNKSIRVVGGSSTRSAQKTFAALKRNGVSGARLTAEMWLELRYGWIPLIEDIDGSIKAVSQYLTRSSTATTVTGSRTTIKDFNVVQTAGLLTSNPQTGIQYVRQKTMVRYGLTFRVDSAITNLFAQLGFTSPVALAWELIPFSFVVDWFLPIGGALQAYSAFDGLTFSKGYKTYFTKEYVTVIYSFSGVDGPYVTSTLNGSGLADSVRMDRTVLTDFPKPNFPRPKNPISLIHAANAAALLVVAFTRK